MFLRNNCLKVNIRNSSNQSINQLSLDMSKDKLEQNSKEIQELKYELRNNHKHILHCQITWPTRGDDLVYTISKELKGLLVGLQISLLSFPRGFDITPEAVEFFENLSINKVVMRNPVRNLLIQRDVPSLFNTCSLTLGQTDMSQIESNIRNHFKGDSLSLTDCSWSWKQVFKPFCYRTQLRNLHIIGISDYYKSSFLLSVFSKLKSLKSYTFAWSTANFNCTGPGRKFLYLREKNLLPFDLPEVFDTDEGEECTLNLLVGEALKERTWRYFNVDFKFYNWNEQFSFIVDYTTGMNLRYFNFNL